MKSPQRIAVIGAGIAGLTCAHELRQAGFEVVVFERESYVGGRMSTREKDGFLFDLGANHLCNLYDRMKEYCASFDIPWRKMEFLDYKMWRGGRLVSLDSSISLLSRLRLGWFLWRLKRDTNYFDLCTAAHYDTTSAYDFMHSVAGQEAADYFADGVTTTYQFHRSREASKAAFMGFIQSVKFDAGKWNLHQTGGGMGALPEALASKLDVRLNTPVQKVLPAKTVQVHTGREVLEFDACVLATTADISRMILSDQTAEQKKVLTGSQYSTSITLAYRVDVNLLPEISIVWTPYIESQTISGYTNEKMKGAHMIRNGKSLFCAWLHEEFAKTIIDKSDEEILSRCKKEVLKVCPWFKNESDLESFDLQRWPCAEPKFSQGHITRVKNFLEKGQGENNIYLCGDYLNAPWTEGALRCGQRVAKTVHNSLVGILQK